MKAINILTIRMIFVYLLLIPVALMKAGVVETSGSRDLLDTLSLEYDDSVGIHIYPGDIIMEIYRVPADLTLNQVGINIGQWNTNGETAKLQVEVFKQGLPAILIVLMAASILTSKKAKIAGSAMPTQRPIRLRPILVSAQDQKT